MTALNGRSQTVITTDIGKAFVQLALGVAHHVPDCLHTYWGPDEWLEAITAEPPSLKRLRDQAINVATAVQKSNLPKNRRQRLQFQTRALLWLIRAQLGEQIIFSEQVRLLLDVQPESVDSLVFSTAQEGLATVLPGGGDLSQRWIDWQAMYTMSLEDVMPHIRQVFDYLDRYWPERVDFNFNLVVTSKSQMITYGPKTICLPAAMPVRVDRLVHMAAQWGIMCGMVSAAAQRYEAGESESAVWLNYGPQQVLAQGLPLAILSASNPYDELIPGMLQAAGLPTIAARQLQAVHMAEDAMGWVDANVALMLHSEGLRPRILRRYMMEHKLVEKDTAENQLHQLADPVWAAHIFSRLIGGPLIKTWLDKSETTIANLFNDPPVPSTMLFEVRFGD
jgi:hypothetical protein